MEDGRVLLNGVLGPGRYLGRPLFGGLVDLQDVVVCEEKGRWIDGSDDVSYGGVERESCARNGSSDCSDVLVSVELEGDSNSLVDGGAHVIRYENSQRRLFSVTTSRDPGRTFAASPSIQRGESSSGASIER